MLAKSARLRRSEEFRTVLRRGKKAGGRRLVVHALTGAPHAEVKAGFVVSKAVGNAVVRHRVSRRLRHVVADRLGTLRPHTALVIRALPRAADARSSDLAADIDSAMHRLSLVESRSS